MISGVENINQIKNQRKGCIQEYIIETRVVFGYMFRMYLYIVGFVFLFVSCRGWGTGGVSDLTNNFTLHFVQQTIIHKLGGGMG